jgi:alpha-glucosidase (family GH31 glycosyl hydrolase)
MQTEATNQYLKSIGLRPFIISRSTSIGSNIYGYHWTGDNKASWEFLRSSIIDNFNAGIAGIQMVGPDICGFEGNTTV